jgi:hypothetical protein
MSRQQKSPRTALKDGAGALETPKKRKEEKMPGANRRKREKRKRIVK